MQCLWFRVNPCVLALVFVAVCFGRPFYILAAEPNDCIQSDYSRVVPFPIPAADVNEPYGSILGPVSGDPNAWEVPAGAWKRDWSRCCDPQNDAIYIAALGGTSAAEVQIDGDAGKWSFAAVVVEGLNLWRFEARDDKGASRIVTVVVWGRKNEPPVLQ